MSSSDWTGRYQHLLFERRPHGVLLVTLNRPEVNNAVNPRLHVELGELWRDVGEDDTVSVAVVTGAGRAFCAGGEVGTFGGERPSSRVDQSLHEVTSLVYEMVNCRKPTIAAVNGLAMASGLALALAADISVVGEEVRLNDGHLRGGMVAGDHAVLLWPLYISLAKARYYLLTGDSLTGREAERLGLVSICVPDEEVLGKALAVASRIATNAQYAVRWTKRALNGWVRQHSALFEHSAALEMLTLFGADVAHAMEAIAAGRKPEFPSVRD